MAQTSPAETRWTASPYLREDHDRAVGASRYGCHLKRRDAIRTCENAVGGSYYLVGHSLTSWFGRYGLP
ncbi:hypothetical protein RvY_02149 [Ramazzottius varieornatus]|uniref:Uncharacterized protein n=1 Tax=Ramazzottius varieornatus TaxID=947166 RepID=A0A1D1UTV8_RAMVA|nr:hypothetical protein RvY_02149 [Ramazzottius varieornatus]